MISAFYQANYFGLVRHMVRFKKFYLLYFFDHFVAIKWITWYEKNVIYLTVVMDKEFNEDEEEKDIAWENRKFISWVSLLNWEYTDAFFLIKVFHCNQPANYLPK